MKYPFNYQETTFIILFIIMAIGVAYWLIVCGGKSC